MTVANRKIIITTQGNCDTIDVTAKVAMEINNSGVANGIACIFISGSTAGITTIENEAGAVNDFQDMWDRNVPREIPYKHDMRWGGGNGYSHVRAALLGPSLVIPVTNGRMTLGTWQQLVVVDFDNRPRSREIVIQIVGE